MNWRTYRRGTAAYGCLFYEGVFKDVNIGLSYALSCWRDVSDESILELTYKQKFGKNIVFQPDIQYVINSGLERNNNMLVGLLKFVLEL